MGYAKDLQLYRANGDHPVAVQLRQEVNFRCPVPGCGTPILTYHHFDPPWDVQEHNNPEGMIALCPKCHGRAEGHHWTKEQLRRFKVNASTQPPAREQLLFLEQNIRPLYRIGGNYFLDVRDIVHGDRPIVWQTQAANGIILFSFDLRRPDGQIFLSVRENSLAVEDLRVWDFRLNTHGTHLILKPVRGRVAMDLHLKRYSLTNLAELMKKDCITVLPPEINQRCMSSDGQVLLIDFRSGELVVRPNCFLLIRKGMVRAGRDGSITIRGGFCCDGGIGFNMW